MIWNDPFYLGKNCSKKYKMLQYRITNRMVHPGVYLLTFPRSGQGILEIIPSLLLLQEHYPTDDLTIVGMGATRGEAISIAEQIVTETVSARGDADIAAYMSQM